MITEHAMAVEPIFAGDAVIIGRDGKGESAIVMRWTVYKGVANGIATEDIQRGPAVVVYDDGSATVRNASDAHSST